MCSVFILIFSPIYIKHSPFYRTYTVPFIIYNINLLFSFGLFNSLRHIFIRVLLFSYLIVPQGPSLPPYAHEA